MRPSIVGRVARRSQGAAAGGVGGGLRDTDHGGSRRGVLPTPSKGPLPPASAGLRPSHLRAWRSGVERLRGRLCRAKNIHWSISRWPQPQQGPGHLGVVPGDSSCPPATDHPRQLCQTSGTRVWSPFPHLGGGRRPGMTPLLWQWPFPPHCCGASFISPRTLPSAFPTALCSGR